MATKAAHKRLTREYKLIQENPTPFITALPSEQNILEWHYVITGSPDTPYEGGQYHGTLVFPSDYPFKPPAIRMITPSGRFKTNTRLCLSISDYHPKTWNPAWSVSTILTGLLSFMVSDESTAGSIISTDDQKREFAKLSYEYNLRSNPRFLEHFPDLVKENSEMIEKKNLERQKEKALKQLAKINVRNQISTLEIPPTSATTVPAQPSVGLTARQKLLCIGIVVVSSMIAYRALI